MKINKAKCETCQHSNCLLFKYCSHKWKQKFDEHKTGRMYKKGEHIFYEGNIVFGIYFICSGKVKEFISGPDGRKQIVCLAGFGNILGHRGLGSKYYPIGASAIEDSHICFIENDVFFQSCKANPELTYNLMLLYADELQNSETRMRNLAQMSVSEKVAEALLMISDVFWKKGKKGTAALDVMLTRQDIADIAGTTQEQVIRTLSEYKKNKLIETKGKQISITDYEGLRNIIVDYESA